MRINIKPTVVLGDIIERLYVWKFRRIKDFRDSCFEKD